MLEKADEIVILLKKYVKGELSSEEKLRLEDWSNEAGENRKVFEEMTDENAFNEAMIDYYKLTGGSENSRSSEQIAMVIKMYARKNPWRLYLVAASVLLVMVITTVYFFEIDRNKKVATNNSKAITPAVVEIPPAGNKAVLTLSDGKRIVLSDANNGMLAKDGKAVINKKQDGELVYDAVDAGTNHSFTYNTVTTPRGGKYQVVLADGSKVWLNAATSLRFPTAFTGKDRTVELSGEAYFQVKASKSKPFKVVIPVPGSGQGQREIEVLGTHFNVNAYQEEPQIRTTLIEGRIKFTASSQNKKPVSTVLKAGQRIIASKDSNNLRLDIVEDPESAIAWVNGKFSFEKNDLASVMRELSRWYDIDIKYQGVSKAKVSYNGEIDRMIPLAELISTLEEMGVGTIRFIIEGRTVKVQP